MQHKIEYKETLKLGDWDKDLAPLVACMSSVSKYQKKLKSLPFGSLWYGGSKKTVMMIVILVW